MPICMDGVKNGTETDVDCGTLCTTKCGVGKHCNGNGDCISGAICLAGTCQTASCIDNIKTPPETDIDCGGGMCGACGDGRTCAVSTDCQSLVCTGPAPFTCK